MILLGNIIFLSFLFIFGLLFGSFASVIVQRIAHGEGGITTGRSHCPKCNHQLSALDLFPLFSYLFLGGKCRYCKEKIGALYPLLEGTMALVFVAMGYASHTSFSAVAMGDIYSILHLLLFLMVGFVLVVISAYDILYLEIPFIVIIPAIIILIAALFFDSLGSTPQLFTHFFASENPLMNIPIINAAWGALIIVGFFYLQIVVSKGQWLGGGDLPIGMLMGLIGGLKIGLLGLFLSYIIGSVVGLIIMAHNKNNMIPFGPFLSAGIIVALVATDFFVPYFPIFAL